MGVHAEDVKRKTFRKVDHGYAVEEVDAFLAELAKAFEQIEVSGLAAAVDAMWAASEPALAHMAAAFTGMLDEKGLIEAVSRLVDVSPRLRKIHGEVETLLRAALLRDVIENEIGGEPRRVLGEDEVMDADELLMEARAAGEVRRQIVQEEMLDAGAVSRLLGSRSVNPRQYANKLRRRAEIIGLRHRNQYLFPAFQFDRDRGRVDPVVLEINQLLRAGDDPWGVASWWLSPNDRLGGRAPKDALQDPDAEKRLVTVARSLIEPLG